MQRCRFFEAQPAAITARIVAHPQFIGMEIFENRGQSAHSGQVRMSQRDSIEMPDSAAHSAGETTSSPMSAPVQPGAGHRQIRRHRSTAFLPSGVISSSGSPCPTSIASISIAPWGRSIDADNTAASAASARANPGRQPTIADPPDFQTPRARAIAAPSSTQNAADCQKRPGNAEIAQCERTENADHCDAQVITNATTIAGNTAAAGQTTSRSKVSSAAKHQHGQ